MQCPYCGERQHKVRFVLKNYDTCTLRVLTCKNCHKNFDTVEKISVETVERENKIRLLEATL